MTFVARDRKKRVNGADFATAVALLQAAEAVADQRAHGRQLADARLTMKEGRPSGENARISHARAKFQIVIPGSKKDGVGQMRPAKNEGPAETQRSSTGTRRALTRGQICG